MARLSNRRLRAMAEALNARLAGEIDVGDDTGLKHEDYEAALQWVDAKPEKNRKKTGRSSQP